MKHKDDIKQETLHLWAEEASKKKQAKYEEKKRKQMLPYRNACKKAARKGHFSKSFKAGYGPLHRVTPYDFNLYFSWDKDFKIEEGKKGWITIRW